MTEWNDMIAKRSLLLDQQCGRPTTAVGTADRMRMMARRTGQTTEMIRGLPPDGKAFIMVLQMSHRYEILDKALQIHGPEYPVYRLRFITSREKLRGGPDWPVYVDNVVLDIMCRDFVEGLQPPPPSRYTKLFPDEELGEPKKPFNHDPIFDIFSDAFRLKPDRHKR